MCSRNNILVLRRCYSHKAVVSGAVISKQLWWRYRNNLL